MAQANTQTAARPTIEQNINDVKASIKDYELTDAFVEGDTQLTNLWSAVKNLEDAAEELRKEVLEAEMENRVIPGERLSGVRHIQSHRKSVEESVGTVIGRAANRGINYTEFVSLDASTLASEYPELATIERNEYSYFR